MGRKALDLTGERFGKLTVLHRANDKVHPSGKHAVMWLCKCDCGNYKEVSKGALVKGETKSCGCLRGKNHGMTGTRIYNTWSDIKKRCNCETRHDYERYGGRGITVCDEWHDFQAFYDWAMSNGYTDELTIERKDTNGNYDPTNCKWATKIEQQNNRRCNHTITYNGETKTVTQWARELNCSDGTIRSRLARGKMSTNEVMAKPITHRHDITYKGETKSLRQWSLQLGITYSLLYKRIFKRHWNVEKAFETI